MNDVEKRLNKALVLDKHFNPEKIREIIKSDIFCVLRNYGTITSDDLDFDIEILDDGAYQVKFKAKIDHLKLFKNF